MIMNINPKEELGSKIKANDNMKTKKDRLKYYLFIPTLSVLIFMTIVPLIFSLFTSFTNYKVIDSINWDFVGFKNYIRALTDSVIIRSFFNTTIFVGIAVLIEFILGMLIALLLNRKLKGISFIRTFLLLPMMVTPVAVGLMWRWMYNTDYGLINYFLSSWFGMEAINWLGDARFAMPAVILVDVWQWTPFVILTILAGLQSLPEDPIEAAHMDGASYWQIFRHVTLPQLKPIILVVLLIRTIDAFNRSFDVVWTLTNGGPGIITELLSLRIYRIAFKYWETGYASAISWIYLIIVLIVTTLFIRSLYKEDTI
jgi:multiple sugar transport system permease protein